MFLEFHEQYLNSCHPWTICAISIVKTKEQKIKKVEEGIEALEKNTTIIFADFSGTKVNDMNALRTSLFDLDTRFEVFKKRLLRVILEKKNFDFNPETLEGQLGVVFSPKPIEEIAGVMYKFSKKLKTFSILGGLELKEKKVLTAEEVVMIGSLPSREALLAQVVGTIIAPLRGFLYVLNEKSKLQ